MTRQFPKPRSNSAGQTRPSVWFALVVVALAWYILLFSGYDLGQLAYGSRILTSEATDSRDVGRVFAYSGIALLTTVPVRLGGAAGVLGCVGLMLRQSWAFIALVLASLLLIWPVLIWIVALTFWRAIDPGGSLLLLVHIVITTAVAFGVPIIAGRRRWSDRDG